MEDRNDREMPEESSETPEAPAAESSSVDGDPGGVFEDDDATLAGRDDATAPELDSGSSPAYGPEGTRRLSGSHRFPRETDLSGSQLGDYRLVRKIAKGGMGEVYEGVQLALDRRVAIKIISEELVSDVTFRQRFEREAKSCAALNHPNVAQVYDFGMDAGRHYLVMEYVDGVDLAAYVKEHGRLSVPEALSVAKQVVSALKFALEQSIIHRDIKPANLLYTPDGVVKITDLGLAKKLSEESDVTMTGTGIGSPHYLAPEQADDARAVDHRADIYALGITLLFLLTGRRPFDGESAFAVVLAHANKPLPPSSELGTSLPEELEALIRRMAEKNPIDRHMDYDELWADIELVEAGLPPSEGPTSVAETAGSARNGLGIVFAVVACVAVGGLLASVFIDRGKGGAEPVKAGGPSDLPAATLAVAKDVAEPPATLEPAQKAPLPKAGSEEAQELLKEKLANIIRLQLPTPPVIPKNPLPDTDLATMLAAAEKFAKENPEQYQHIIARYEQAARKAEGTPRLKEIEKALGDWEIRFFAADGAALQTHMDKVESAFFNRRPHEAFAIWKDFPTNLLSEAILKKAVDQLLSARGPFLTQLASGGMPDVTIPPELVIPAELIPSDGVSFGGDGVMAGGRFAPPPGPQSGGRPGPVGAPGGFGAGGRRLPQRPPGQ